MGTGQEHGSKLWTGTSFALKVTSGCLNLISSLAFAAVRHITGHETPLRRPSSSRPQDKPCSPKPDGYLHLKLKKSLVLHFFLAKGKAWVWLQLALLLFSRLSLREIQKPQKDVITTSALSNMPEEFLNKQNSAANNRPWPARLSQQRWVRTPLSEEAFFPLWGASCVLDDAPLLLGRMCLPFVFGGLSFDDSLSTGLTKFLDFCLSLNLFDLH